MSTWIRVFNVHPDTKEHEFDRFLNKIRSINKVAIVRSNNKVWSYVEVFNEDDIKHFDNVIWKDQILRAIK